MNINAAAAAAPDLSARRWLFAFPPSWIPARQRVASPKAESAAAI